MLIVKAEKLFEARYEEDEYSPVLRIRLEKGGVSIAIHARGESLGVAVDKECLRELFVWIFTRHPEISMMRTVKPMSVLDKTIFANLSKTVKRKLKALEDGKALAHSIISLVEVYFQLEQGVLLRQGKRKPVSRARGIVHYLIRHNTELTMTAIADLSGMHHAAVVVNCKNVLKRKKNCPQTRRALTILQEKIDLVKEKRRS